MSQNDNEVLETVMEAIAMIGALRRPVEIKNRLTQNGEEWTLEVVAETAGGNILVVAPLSGFNSQRVAEDFFTQCICGALKAYRPSGTLLSTDEIRQVGVKKPVMG